MPCLDRHIASIGYGVGTRLFCPKVLRRSGGLAAIMTTEPQVLDQTPSTVYACRSVICDPLYLCLVSEDKRPALNHFFCGSTCRRPGLLRTIEAFDPSPLTTGRAWDGQTLPGRVVCTPRCTRGVQLSRKGVFSMDYSHIRLTVTSYDALIPL